MVFIHTADIHLGMVPDIGSNWSTDRAYDIKETFFNVIKKCKEVRADLLLIAGDLFNKQPLTSDLNEINEQFSTIPNTQIVIISGNADKIRDNSTVLSYRFNKNVHYIFSEHPTELEIPNLNLVIHGFSYHHSEIKRSLIDSIPDPEYDGKIHILLAHGGDTLHCPIDFNSLSNRNFNYCALGHLHTFQDMFNHKIVYPGSLEPLDISEASEHGVCIGEINTMTGRLERFHFEPMAKVEYIAFNVKVNIHNTNEDIIDTITSEISKKSPENIYRIHLEGYRDPNVHFDFTSLNRFRIIDIIDETEPKYDFLELSKEHPQDMIGAYIRTFNKNIDELSLIQKKALYYGINALLKSSELG